MKSIMCSRGTWMDFLQHIMFLKYLDEKNPLPEEGIFIKELNFQLGGEVTIVLRDKE